MRQLLDWILRAAVGEDDRLALLGDLEEEYRDRVRPRRSRIGAQAWWAREILAAVVLGVRERARRPSVVSSARRSIGHRGLLAADVRYALRRSRHRPGFTVTIVATLSLGIAATTALFSVVDAVLLAPLPWKSPDQLVVIHAVQPGRQQNPVTAATWNRGRLSERSWGALQADGSFEAVAAWRDQPSNAPNATTLGEDRAEIVPCLYVSSNFLPTLGVGLAHGRNFLAVEELQPSDAVMLTHETWHRRFGGRPDIVGQTFVLGDTSGAQAKKTIVGVLARGFRFEAEQPEFLLPIRRGGQGSSPLLRVVARLKAGVSLAAATSATQNIVGAIQTQEPTTARLVPLADDQVRDARGPLWLLFGAAGLLLLVACTSVAGLLLGDARGRRAEFAVRAALGGTRGRAVRQLFVEYGLMAVAGAIVGLVLSVWLIRLFVAVAPAGLPRLETVAVDFRVAAFAMVAGICTLAVSGLVPALSLASTPAATGLAEAGRDGAAGRHHAQRMIVAAAISLALVLLVGTTLFGQTMYRLTSRPLGFDPAGLVVIKTRFTGIPWGSGAVFKALEGRKDFSQQLSLVQAGVESSRTALVLERLIAISGVLNAAGASHIPFTGVPTRIGIQIDGFPAAVPHQVARLVVTEEFFDVMRMTIAKGRGFQQSDAPAGNAVVVSREFERRYLVDDALGRRFTYTWGPQDIQRTSYEVVGVVANVKHREFADGDEATVYMFNRQSAGITQFVVRTSGDAAAILPRVREAIRAVDPLVVVTATDTVEHVAAGSIAEERLRASLSAIFGGAALILAAVGLYGLTARRVADRRREFGVRVALGARPRDVRGLVVRDALWTVGLGLAVGVPAAVAATQLTRSMLFGVSPTAPHVFAIAIIVLGSAAFLATAIPARRAARTDPMAALKE